MSDLTVSVRIGSGSSTYVIQSSSAVSDFRLAIANKNGLSSSQVILVHKGRVLSDSETVMDVSLGQNSSIIAIHKVTGG